MILGLPPFSTTTRVLGLLSTQGTPKHVRYVISLTSKPVSRLIKASCNPLSADEILSITVPISIRCSSEMAARPTNSLRTSDRTPGGAGLFRLLSSGAVHWGLLRATRLSSGLTGSGEALRDDTLGSHASGAEESGGGVSLSIIFERRSPEDKLISEGLRPEVQDICGGCFLRGKR